MTADITVHRSEWKDPAGMTSYIGHSLSAPQQLPSCCPVLPHCNPKPGQTDRRGRGGVAHISLKWRSASNRVSLFSSLFARVPFHCLGMQSCWNVGTRVWYGGWVWGGRLGWRRIKREVRGKDVIVWWHRTVGLEDEEFSPSSQTHVSLTLNPWAGPGPKWTV